MAPRDSFLREVVILGAALLLVTETLNAFAALTRGPLIIAWILVVGVRLFVPAARQPFRFTLPALTFDPAVLLCATASL